MIKYWLGLLLAYILFVPSCFGQCTDSVQTIKYTSSLFHYDASGFPSITTADNATLIYNPVFLTKENGALLFKVSADGEIVWGKKIQEPYPFAFSLIHEMSNGNILLAGSGKGPDEANDVSLVLLMLNADGKILWQNMYYDENRSLFALCRITEGLNRDIIIANGNNITRFDNNGKVIWSHYYKPNNPGLFFYYPMGIYCIDNKIYTGGIFTRSNYSSPVPRILMLQLDYNTGEIYNRQSFQFIQDSASSYITASYDGSLALIKDDRFMLSFGIGHHSYYEDFGSPPPFISSLSVLLDTTLQLIRPATEIFTPYRDEIMTPSRTIDKDGNLAYCLTKNTGSSIVYYTLIDSANALKAQREITYNNEVIMQAKFTLKEKNILNSVLALKKGDDFYFKVTNTSPEYLSGIGCTGRDTAIFNTRQLTLAPEDYDWHLERENNIMQNALPVTEEDFAVNSEITCKQISTCNYVKINGLSDLCLSDSIAQLTVSKNKFCYKKVDWKITDTTAVSIVSQPANTSIIIKLKKAWKGYIYASIEGCNIKDSLLIDIHNPANTVNFGDTTLCAGDTLILQAGPPGMSTYLWQDGSTNNRYPVINEGQFRVKVTDALGCVYNDTANVRLSPLPTVQLGKDTSICSGQYLQLKDAVPNADYLWNTRSTSSYIKINSPGIYWLKITANGCTNADSIMVSHRSSPLVNLGNDTTLCTGQHLLLNATVPDATYQWQDGKTTPAYNVAQAGIYNVKINSNGCDTTAKIKIDYLSAPIINLGNDTTLCHNNILLLNAYNSLNGNVSYQWQDESTLPQFKVSKPGTYSIKLSNRCGVKNDSIKISYGDCSFKLFVPSAFTPNNDGMNDIFKAHFKGNFTSFSMKIYNRWAQLIFSTNDPGEGWNGTFKNQAQPIGTYIWEITYKDRITEKTEIRRGTIVLIR